VPPIPHPTQRRPQHRGLAVVPVNPPSLLALIFVMMVATSCNESFTPIEPSDLQFSVYGYLDASADTQWIRVMPIRPLVLTSPDPLEATVTLEHLGTGRIIELRDSVFRFSQYNAQVGSDGVYLHNFWTTERIEPGATYQFSAKRDGERPSEAVVEIPPDYEVEVWIRQNRSPTGDRVRLVGLKHVALVRAASYYYDTCGSGVDRIAFFPAHPADSGVLVVPVSKRQRFRDGCGTPEVEKRELLVVGSGAAWPAGQEFSASGLGVPNVPSTISNSLGFLGGVLTKTIPYEDCYLDSRRPVTDYCKLRYDAASATLRGTLRDAVCGGGVARADVRLGEINPEPPALPKIRSTRSNRSGEFQIGALEAGRRYALSVRRIAYDEEGRPFDEYQEHTNTLEFAPGEQATYDAELRRLDPCPKR
jgi:hypothetical protein